MKELLSHFAVWIYDHVFNLLFGYVVAVFAYFAEIQGAVHVMWAAILVDLIAGIFASVIKRKEKFCMTKFFTAVGRAIGVTILIALLYAMDKEMHQEIAASYYIAAWIITGFYAWSFAENMDTLFGGRIFGILKGFLRKRVEDQTGVDISGKEAKNGRF